MDFLLSIYAISINPEITKYRYQVSGNEHQGIENSAEIYKNLLYFADNGGSIQCVDLLTLKPVWIYNGKFGLARYKNMDYSNDKNLL